MKNMRVHHIYLGVDTCNQRWTQFNVDPFWLTARTRFNIENDKNVQFFSDASKREMERDIDIQLVTTNIDKIN